MKIIYKAFITAIYCIIFIINVNASTYKIEELKLSVNIPEGFYIINRSSSTSDIQTLNLDPTLIKERMLNFDSYLMLYDFESEIHISKIENSFTKKIDNLFYSSQDIVNSLGNGYSKGFGEYKVYETDSIKYLVFDYSLNTKDGIYYYLKYKTIINGMEITVNYINLNEFTVTDKQQMTRIINSINFDYVSKSEKSDFNLIYIVGVTLLFISPILLNRKIKKTKNPLK